VVPKCLLRGPPVVREIGWIGLRIRIQINILCFAEHQMILSGPRTEKFWEPLPYEVHIKTTREWVMKL